MLTSLHTLYEDMVLKIAYYLTLGFDWGIDKILVKCVRIPIVTNFY